MKILITILALLVSFNAHAACKVNSKLTVCKHNKTNCIGIKKYTVDGECVTYNDNKKLCGNYQVFLTDYPKCDGKTWQSLDKVGTEETSKFQEYLEKRARGETE